LSEVSDAASEHTPVKDQDDVKDQSVVTKDPKEDDKDENVVTKDDKEDLSDVSEHDIEETREVRLKVGLSFYMYFLHFLPCLSTVGTFSPREDGGGRQNIFPWGICQNWKEKRKW